MCDQVGFISFLCMDIIQAYNSRENLVLKKKVNVFNSACGLGTLSKDHSATKDTLFKDRAPRKPYPIGRHTPI